MNSIKLLYAGAITAFGIANIGAVALAQSRPPQYPVPPAAEGEVVSGAPRPTPPSTRALDPSAVRQGAESEVKMVRVDPRDYIQNASELLEQEVQNEDGERLGTIEDFAIDVNSGRIEFIAVGPGEDLRMVPPHAFQPIPEEGRVRLDMDSGRWDRAPSIQRDEIANLARDRDVRRIYRFYDLDHREGMAMAVAEEETIFGAPAHRWQQRHRGAEAQRMTIARPVAPRAHPRVVPPDGAEAPQNVRWEREFGTPTERIAATEEKVDLDISREKRATELSEADAQIKEREAAIRARSAEAERTELAADETAREGPALQNPRLHNSRRGSGHTTGTDVAEFGAPTHRDAAGERRSLISGDDRLQWGSDLLGQTATDMNQQAIGELSDLIVDLNRRQVQHVIVSHDGAEQQKFAIPMREVQIDADRQVAIRGDLSALQDAPLYEQRQARLQPNQIFRYEESSSAEFGAPAREGSPEAEPAQEPEAERESESEPEAEAEADDL